MHIVSYRGPHRGGGVASLIRTALKYESECKWWHMNDNCLQRLREDNVSIAASVSSRLVGEHYRYCNEFLWPLMHGRPELASYNEADYISYRALNMAVAANIGRDKEPAFIHDYQLALVPAYLSASKSSASLLFWHIPWPCQFPAGAEAQIVEIARGLLQCGTVGFHLDYYVKNFLAFVQRFLPEYNVLANENAVTDRLHRRVEIIARPAGIDYGYWHQFGKAAANDRPLFNPYILSVDRADYTKGVLERIQAVGEFFRRRPKLIGQIQFVFICQQTRLGLPAFDAYWAQCRAIYRAVVESLATSEWSPILWLDEDVPPQVLAKWYAHANIMLVNPSIDGLNLTAKEFAATSIIPDSALVLSEGAGVWEELHANSTTIRKCCAGDIADAVVNALIEPSLRRRANMNALKRKVYGNTLQTWWQDLVQHVQLIDKDPIRVGTSA